MMRKRLYDDCPKGYSSRKCANAQGDPGNYISKKGMRRIKRISRKDIQGITWMMNKMVGLE
jgi:hypothetical protein